MSQLYGLLAAPGNLTGMRDQTIEAFLSELAARVPAPGGGATAALHAAQAAALLAMVARYSDGPRYDAELMGRLVQLCVGKRRLAVAYSHPLGKLLGGFYVTCLVFVFGVLGPVCSWSGFSLLKLIRYFREELLIVFATTSSETVLPRMIARLEDLGCEESVVGLVIPTGYSFNLDGTCLYLATATVFLAQATNTPLNIGQQIGLLAVLLLTSKGAAGVAGAAFVVLAATLSTAGTIPVASVALILGIHRLMSEGLTPTNLIGNAVATIVVAKWEGALDEDRLHKALDGNLPNRLPPVAAL